MELEFGLSWRSCAASVIVLPTLRDVYEGCVWQVETVAVLQLICN